MTNPTATCRLCGASELKSLLDLGAQPVAHRLLQPGADDDFTHPLTIDYCTRCGLGQIVDPVDPEILYRDFNYCFTSWKPEPHRGAQVEWLTSAKPGASIFEIGCNDGLFLADMIAAGHGPCVGLEPNRVAGKTAAERGIRVFNEFLEPDLLPKIKEEFGQFDLVVSRQVLEHVAEIDLFFQFANELLKDDGLLFIDVPDVGANLEVGDVSVAWEEHVNYFTKPVLTAAFKHYGFDLIEARRYNFSGCCLSALAKKGEPATEYPSVDLSVILEFDALLETYRKKLANLLAQAKADGKEIVLYGVGCRACAFVNGLELSGIIDYAVDDQEEKQGLLMAGSKLEIRPSEALDTPAEKLVLLAVNNENEEKVGNAIIDRFGADRFTLLSVLAPTKLSDAVDEAAAALSTAGA